MHRFLWLTILLFTYFYFTHNSLGKELSNSSKLGYSCFKNKSVLQGPSLFIKHKPIIFSQQICVKKDIIFKDYTLNYLPKIFIEFVTVHESDRTDKMILNPLVMMICFELN